MAATFPLARSLLALACFALLVADSTASRRDLNQLNCAEYLSGKSSTYAIDLDPKTTTYQKITKFHTDDNCLMKEKRLVGALIKACDPLGPPAPSIHAINIQDQLLQCHTDGPCPSGLVVTVSQYCE